MLQDKTFDICLRIRASIRRQISRSHIGRRRNEPSKLSDNISFMNRIIGVSAIIGGERYDLPAPNRHHNIYRKITEDQRTIANDAAIEEGFYDEEGYFLDRRTALIRSKKTGQFNRRRNPNYYDGPELFSEDLW